MFEANAPTKGGGEAELGSFLHTYNYDTVPLKSYLVFRLWREAEEGEILVVLNTVVPTNRRM